MLVTLALLAGCGVPSDIEVVEPTRSQAVTSVPASADSEEPVSSRPTEMIEAAPFGSLIELRDGLVDIGIGCDDWKEVAPDFGGTCDTYTVLGWYPDTPEGSELKEAAIKLALSAIESGDASGLLGVVEGPDWTVRCLMSDCEAIQAVFGGELYT